jgi:hypothetical protein
MNSHRRNQERNGEKKGRRIDIHVGKIISGEDDTKHHIPYLQNKTIFGNKIFHIFCPWISE